MVIGAEYRRTVQLERLTEQHRDAVLEFETTNRAYFAASVPDRGDDYFADYPARHASLLAMQAAGTDFFHVLVTEDGTIAGRVNLVCIVDNEAELGYRIGRDFAGCGLATQAVRDVCQLARCTYGLNRLRAATTLDNHASRKILLRNGFTIVGSTTLDERPGLRFVLDLKP